jgi:hypothetical protein
MSTIIRSALIALVLTSATASIAAPVRTPDTSNPYGGFAPNSTEGARAFWEYQSQHHGA